RWPRDWSSDVCSSDLIGAAKDAKALGFKFLLDFHYSDTWADPAKQFLPKAWEGKTHAELVSAVREYTRDTIAALRENGVMPDMRSEERREGKSGEHGG